ncbi:MAG TPA: carboxymuconolactone decarboxylase family protein [Acidimicrobiales bacterium]|nr:carboxymuconolactone decarboxylase family protein [Acidimicrobiales bacterium]
MTRITPLTPPYGSDASTRLARMTPPGTEPIALFRTLVRNPAMADAMAAWGRYELGRDLSLTRRDREIVIDRTCARCGCEYEWGVHVAYFAERVGLTADQIASLTSGDASDACWTDERDRVLVEAADALHDTHDIDDALWARLAATFDDAQLLDLLALAGWYHAVSYLARATRLANEPGAPTFGDTTGAGPAGG